MTQEIRPICANTAAIVLAAGKGTRMKSDTPKVLHRVCGTPMLGRILRTLDQAGIKSSCLVLSEETSAFSELLQAHQQLTAVIQHKRLGTGDAVAAAACAFDGETVASYSAGSLWSGEVFNHDYVLICAGDTPALEPSILQDFVVQCQNAKARLGVIGMNHPHPTGYGRLILDADQRLQKIVEEKDADLATKQIKLCNSGVIFAQRAFLFQCLQNLRNDNAQQEYYLTDCFQMAADQGQPAYVYQTAHFESFNGVNQRSQLAAIEQWIVKRRIEALMAEGVSFHLPDTCYLEDDVQIGKDTEIGPHCSLTGQTRIGRDCKIGSHCALHNIDIADGEIVAAGSILSDS